MTPRRAAAATALLLATTPGVHAEAPVTLEADQIVIEDSVATSEGPVELHWRDHRIVADGCRIDAESGVVLLGPGRWESALGTGSFDKALIDLRDNSGRVSQGHFEGPGGTPKTDARRLIWSADGTIRAQDVTFTPCGCAEPPWSISARRVRAKPDQQASFTGGTLRVCGAPVFPLPAGIVPLKDRKAGLLPPRIGYGQDGLIVAQPLFTPLGEAADATVTPEWRQARLGRVLGETRVQPSNGPLSVVRGAVGRDALDDPNRGMVDVQHGTSTGLMRIGVDATWTSDQRYLSDYGDDFLSRSAPWTETLATAGAGPLRIESDTFQGTDPIGQRPLGGVLGIVGVPMGPVRADAVARVDTFDVGTAPWQTRAATERVAAAAVAGVGDHWGPFQAEGRVEGRVVGWSGHEPWQEGRVGGVLRVPLWADVGDWRHLADVGLAARTSAVAGRPVVRLPEDQPDPLYGVGPEVRSQWLATDGVPVALSAAAPWTPDGWDPAVGGRAQIGAWSVRAAGSRVLQDAATGWDDGRLRLGVGLAHFDAILQGAGDVAWSLPGPLSEWRPGYLALHDLVQDRLVRHGPTLSFTSRCNCLRLTAAAEWAEDRPVPDAMMRLDLR